MVNEDVCLSPQEPQRDEGLCRVPGAVLADAVAFRGFAMEG